MIDATVTADKYAIKRCHKMASLNNIRLIIPKDWDCEYVNVILWESDISELKITDSEMKFTIPKVGEIFLKKVIKSSERQYIYIPTRYDGLEVLIVPV